MKFEKFLKSVGAYGTVYTRNESEKWLVCGGVGMVIPKGVQHILGSEFGSEYAHIIEVISTQTYDDPLHLSRAVLNEADGKASDIYRIFQTAFDEEIGIINADYGLIERKDLLGYMDIEIDTDEEGNPLPIEDCKTIKYMLVYNQKGEIQGYITGSQQF